MEVDTSVRGEEVGCKSGCIRGDMVIYRQLPKTSLVRGAGRENAVGPRIITHPAIASRRTACCITEGGTTQAHTATKLVGSSAREDWTLKRTLVEVRTGADLRNPPLERGAEPCSQLTAAAPPVRICSKTSRWMQFWGEPVSRSATQPKAVEGVDPLCTAILVVKEALSNVIVPPMRLGPCSESKGVSAEVGATQEATASTSGLWSAGVSENWVEKSEGGPGQAPAESRRRISSAG